MGSMKLCPSMFLSLFAVNKNNLLFLSFIFVKLFSYKNKINNFIRKACGSLGYRNGFFLLFGVLGKS